MKHREVQELSERTFFSLRYALPGYTFLLMLILVSYPSLIKAEIIVQDSTLVATFLVFFSLLGGSALGFLISQIWYAIHIYWRRTKYSVVPETIKFLQNEYDLTQEKDYQVVFGDYVHRLSDKKTLIYAQRRFDLMHVFGSTSVALILGSAFGLIIRFQIPSLNDPFDVFLILMFIALLALLYSGLHHSSKEHAMAFDFSVRKVVNSREFPPYQARLVFGERYFQKKCKHCWKSKRLTYNYCINCGRKL